MAEAKKSVSFVRVPYEKAQAKAVRFTDGSMFAGSQDYIATTTYWGILECRDIVEWTGEARFNCRTVLARNITFPDKPGAPEVQYELIFTCLPFRR